MICGRRNSKVEVSERRISTASPLLYPLHLISVETLLRLYANDPSARLEAHQFLKERELLTLWTDLPSTSKIIFVSHEWVGWNHPDPNGTQLQVLCRCLERLSKGEIPLVGMNIFCRLLFNERYETKGREWVSIMKDAYIWLDWICMPQPNAESSRTSSPLSPEALTKLQNDAGRAIGSIAAYVERADFVLVLVPSCVHKDRKDPFTKRRVRTCYRTWRKRGWCVLELAASYLSREKQHPLLVVSSKNGVPEWISNMEAVKLRLGLSDFTCCQRNHNFSDSRGAIVACDKPRCRDILKPLIRRKVQYLHSQRSQSHARVIEQMSRNLMMGLGDDDEERRVRDCTNDPVAAMKTRLRWNANDGEFFDREGISLLMYAVIDDDVRSVRDLLHSIASSSRLSKRQKVLRAASRLPKRVLPYFCYGVGKGTALIAAMAWSSTEVVAELLKSPYVDPLDEDMNGLDAFMYGSCFGRIDNMDTWMSTLPDWDVERKNWSVGGAALCQAVRKRSFVRCRSRFVFRYLKQISTDILSNRP